MKTSNKLLLAGFLMVVALISALHITLYAKYKAGNYSTYNADDELPADALQSFPNTRVVVLRNLRQANVQFANSTQLERTEEGGFQVQQRGDTLVIAAKDSTKQDGIWHAVNLRLPASITVMAFHTSLRVESGRTAADPVFLLEKSAVDFFGPDNIPSFGEMKLVATENSAIYFRNKSMINRLDLQLSNSIINYDGGEIGQLSIQSDSLSHISFPSKQLLKATINPLPK